MILSVAMPMVDPSLRSGKLISWQKREGESIEFGDELCRLGLDEFAVLRRTARATLLSGRRQRRLKSELETREGKVFLEVVVVASETGVLHRVLKEPGDHVAVGDILGIVSTAPLSSETEADSWESLPLMRVIADVVSERA